jgi:hypothetical protein
VEVGAAQVLLEEMRHTKREVMEATGHLPLSPVLMLYMQAEAVVVLIQELLDLAEQAVAAQL